MGPGKYSGTEVAINGKDLWVDLAQLTMWVSPRALFAPFFPQPDVALSFTLKPSECPAKPNDPTDDVHLRPVHVVPCRVGRIVAGNGDLLAARLDRDALHYE